MFRHIDWDRNHAPNGLSLSVGNFKGVRVLESFTPTMEGALSVDYSSDPIGGANTIKPVPGKQAAVTFGVGVSTQELTNALHRSQLFAMGAAASEFPP